MPKYERRRSAIFNDEKLTSRDEKLIEAIVDGKTVKQAAKIAQKESSMVYDFLKKPYVVEAIQTRRDAIRKKARVTREEVVEGLKSAVRDAKLLGDPQAQIAGWREIGRMLGYYEPEKKIIELSDKKEEALVQLQSLDVQQLMDMAGGDILDGEFELVEEEPRALNPPH